MGGAASKSKKGNFLLGVENLVTRLLMKQSWKDMQKLEQPEHCQKLIAITSKVLQKHLNSREIKYLANRVKTGEERPEKMQNVSWIPKHVLDELNKTKQQNCQGIAKFYIRIAHVYTAIIKTINPQYVFNDRDNVKQKIPLLQYGKIPSNVEKKLEQFGFCQRRINALKYKTNDDGTLTINPSPCKLIQQKYRDQHGTCVTKYKTFAAEPGVPELLQLYKDVYNYDPRTGKPGRYSRITPESMKQYKRDLALFYKTFTGKSLPSDITRFSQIKLKDYSCRYDQRIKCPGSRRPRERTIDPQVYQPVTMHTPPTNRTTQTYPTNRSSNRSSNRPTNTPSNRPTSRPPSSQFPTRVAFDLGLQAKPVPYQRPKMKSYPRNDEPRNNAIMIGGKPLDNRFLKVRHKAYTGKKSSDTFLKYANHLARMIQWAQQSQEKLLNILQRLFVAEGETYTIHPKLNEAELQKITTETREIIVKLYIKCEEDFRKGLELFDDIIEEKELQKINRAIDSDKKDLEAVIGS